MFINTNTTRIVNAMFRRCLKKVFKADIISSNDIYKYDDADMLCICRNVDEKESKDNAFIKDIVTRLDNRNLLKSVCSTRLNEFENPPEIFDIKKGLLISVRKRLVRIWTLIGIMLF